MCGIAGIVTRAPGSVNADLANSLEHATDSMVHRGPDDRGVWHTVTPDGAFVGLGSRRLAILDLSEAGRMPMQTDDGEVIAVYNGEVYNFRELRRELEGRGTTIAMSDYLIAGICRARSLPLLTRNRSHFERVPGLRVEAP